MAGITDELQGIVHEGQGGGQQGGHCHDVSVELQSGVIELLDGDIDAQVMDFKAVASQQSRANVLADVMNVALGLTDNDNASLRIGVTALGNLVKDNFVDCSHCVASQNQLGQERIAVVVVFGDLVHADAGALVQDGHRVQIHFECLVNQFDSFVFVAVSNCFCDFCQNFFLCHVCSS